MLSPQMAVLPLGNDGRQYSLSPSISAASISARGSPPATIGSDMVPMATLSLTSSMLPPSMQAYTDPCAFSSQPYTMVQHPSGLRHNSVHKSSPESSGFRSSPSAMGPPFQSLNVSQVEGLPAPQGLDQRRPTGQPAFVAPILRYSSLGLTNKSPEIW
jgi:hypothetical protein